MRASFPDSPPEQWKALESRYRPVRRIGSTPSSELYEAIAIGSGRPVAIKISRNDVESREPVSREAERLACGISHPHLARVLECGQVGGRDFSVLEFIEGESLRVLLDREGKLDQRSALELMRQILDALAALHGLGIVHRDVKPENIMLRRGGGPANAVLVDFGFAAASNGAVVEELVGSLRYAAPEQLRREITKPCADLYAWALTLLECLTGVCPVAAEAAHEAWAEQSSERAVEIPPQFEGSTLGRLLLALTSKDPARRPRSAVEALELLVRAAPSTRNAAALVDAAVGRSLVFLTASCTADTEEKGATPNAGDGDWLHDLVQRHGGILMASSGGRMQAAFGLPAGDFHDARHAVECANALLADDGPDLSSGSHWRIGIHSARLDASTIAAAGAAAALDKAFGTAARFEQSLRPGRIAISPAVEPALRGEWKIRQVGRVATDSGELPLYRVDGKRKDEAPANSEIIGREAALQRIENAWRLAKRGTPGAILMTGPPGIGKSMLLREARGRVSDHDCYSAVCARETSNVAFHLLASLLRSFSRSAISLTRYYDLPQADALPILATLLGEPLPAGVMPPAVTPERLKELSIRTAITLLHSAALDGPLLLTVEDVQWADPSSLDAVEAFVSGFRKEGATLPVLLLLTARPEFAQSRDTTGFECLDVAPLEREGAEAMIRSRIGDGADLTEDALLQVIGAASGSPLFLEQAARLLRAQPDDVAPATVPLSISGILEARIALLSEDARKLAQAGGAIGLQFEASIAAAAASLRAHEYRDAAAQLADAGIADVVRTAAGKPNDLLEFSHALLRDAAYESLPRSERRMLHARIARILQQDRSDIAAQRPAELARHCEEAGQRVEAADLWHRVGVQALSSAAYPEARLAMERGVGLLAGCEESMAVTMRRLALVTSLGSTHVTMKGFGAPESRDAFVEARRLSERLGREVPLEVLGGIFGAALVTADEDEMLAIMPQFEELSRLTNDPLRCFAGHQVLSVQALWNARFEDAHRHADLAVKLYRREAVHGLAWEFGFGIHSYAYLMMSLFHRGFADQAESIRIEMLDRAEKHGNPHCLAVALGWATTLTVDTGRDEETLSLATRLGMLASEQHLLLWGGYGSLARGNALSRMGRHGEALAQIREGLAILDAVGVRCGRAYYLAYLAEALLHAGDPVAALEAATEGADLCTRVWTRLQESEQRRLMGVALARMSRREDAAATLRAAADMAQRDGSRAVALRAVTDLASLDPACSESSSARAELESMLTAVSEGFGTADVRRAGYVAGGR